MVTSKGVNEDIVMASIEAYLKGMNVLLMQEVHPEKRWTVKKGE